jgi:hypothetical protein
MSDLIRHARTGLTGLRAGDGVISSTRPPGSGPLLLDIDFASCRAAILGGAAPDPRRGHLGFLFFSFLIVSDTKTQPLFAPRLTVQEGEPQPANVTKRKR